MVNIPFVNSGSDLQDRDRIQLAPPAARAFVILQDGTIAFSEAHADFRVRPEPADVLEILASI